MVELKVGKVHCVRSGADAVANSLGRDDHPSVIGEGLLEQVEEGKSCLFIDCLFDEVGLHENSLVIGTEGEMGDLQETVYCVVLIMDGICLQTK